VTAFCHQLFTLFVCSNDRVISYSYGSFPNQTILRRLDFSHNRLLLHRFALSSCLFSHFVLFPNESDSNDRVHLLFIRITCPRNCCRFYLAAIAIVQQFVEVLFQRLCLPISCCSKPGLLKLLLIIRSNIFCLSPNRC